MDLSVFEGLIPMSAGIWATLAGHRKIGKPLGADKRYDAWFDKYAGMLRTFGPLLVCFGVFMVAIKL